MVLLEYLTTRDLSGGELTWADNLTREDLDVEPSVVQMLDVDGASGKSCDEINLRVVEEVIILPLEPRVWLLLNLKDNIAWQNTRCLVALSLELDFVAAPDAPIHMDVENLSLDDGLLAVAALAPILLADDLAFTIAIGADSLEPLDHGAHLTHHGLHTVAITASTFSHSTLFATPAIALGADYGLLQGELRDLASVDILKGDLVSVVDSASLWWAALLHSSTKHASKTTAECRTASKEL